jgi:hypothetical protein
MPINCDIILQWNATSGQLRALGAALWRWCRHGEGDTGVYQHLDNQTLADLLAGQLPAPSQASGQAGGRGVCFRVRDETSQDRQATTDSLRRDLPSEGVQDILVDGKSWI